MTHTLTPKAGLGDLAASLLRTAIPGAWGALIGLLLTWAGPHLPVDLVDALADWLGGPAAVSAVTVASLIVWYWVWRWVEQYVPDWLVTLVLGYAKPPTYAPLTADGAAVITTLPDDEADADTIKGLALAVYNATPENSEERKQAGELLFQLGI